MLRRLFALLLFALLLTAAAADSDGKRWWSHVQFLADDKLEGRNTGSEGYRKAATYVAGEFDRAGLEPAGTSGYFQPVRFTSRRIVEEQSSLALEREGSTQPLALGEDATISLRTEPPETLRAPIVFVGYGLTVPELNHDDLAGLDLKGKVVLYISGGPSSIPGPLRSHYQSTGERWKFLERAGVVGTLQIQNPRSVDIPWTRSALARFQPSMSLAAAGLAETTGRKLSVTINPAHADKLFAGTGHSFDELLKQVQSGQALPRFAIPAMLVARVRFEGSQAESPNVAAVLRGSDPKLKDEFVVLSAHLDHIGIGRPINGDSIYNGAMDNASGIATLLEVAARLHETRTRFRRSLLFVAVTGEEKGLLGSKYFTSRPTVKPQALIANLNVDMFLPLFPLRILTVYGLDESDLGSRVREVAGPLGLSIQGDLEPDRNVFIRSDQYNFIRHGAPALAFKVGYEKGSKEEGIAKAWLKERYHAPSDDLAQPVDLGAAAAFNRLIARLTEAVANRDQRPLWNKTSFFRRFTEPAGL